MSSINIGPTIPDPTLRGVTELTQPASKPGEANPLESFGKMLEQQIGNVDGDMKAADQSTESFLRGGETSIHEVMIATSKADISFRLMTQVGRKVVEAYQEIMRMQV